MSLMLLRPLGWIYFWFVLAVVIDVIMDLPITNPAARVPIWTKGAPYHWNPFVVSALVVGFLWLVTP